MKKYLNIATKLFKVIEMKLDKAKEEIVKGRYSDRTKQIYEFLVSHSDEVFTISELAERLGYHYTSTKDSIRLLEKKRLIDYFKPKTNIRIVGCKEAIAKLKRLLNEDRENRKGD